MEIEKNLPLLLGILGLTLLFIGAVYPLVTLIVDTTPPQWSIASDGKVALYPRDREVYATVNKIQAAVNDPESGVNSVTAVLDGTAYTLSLQVGDIYNGVWFLNIPDVTTSGQHSIMFTAVNKAGLSNTYTGTFTIYAALQGTWYVADTAITSSSQTVYVTIPTVSFKFVKTVGIEDSKIKCTVTEGATTILTLANTASGTWTGSYTFTPGSHTIALKADDGTNTITFSIINFEIPGAPTPITITKQQVFLVLGIAILAIAIYKGIIKPK